MSADKEKSYPLGESQRKTCELFKLLAGHEVYGLSPTEIANGLGVNASWVTRNLHALATTGFVELVPVATTRWRLGTAFVQIAATVSNTLMTSKTDLTDQIHNFSVRR